MGAELGFGVSGPHGAFCFSEKRLARLIAQAREGGVRHFDTAPFYGEAEARLGRALKAAGGGDAIVSTKTGTRRSGGRLSKDFSPAAIRTDVDGSLRQLHREALDLLYLHGPSPGEIDAALPTLLELKGAGKIKAIGVCGEGASLDHALARGIDSIMGVYNVLDRRHAAVFARAKSAGVKTVAIAPLAQGAFAEPKFQVTLSALWRLARRIARPRPSIGPLKRARKALSGVAGLTANGVALAFVLQDAPADLVLTTTTNARHLAESLETDGKTLDEAVLARLRALDPAGGQS